MSPEAHQGLLGLISSVGAAKMTDYSPFFRFMGLLLEVGCAWSLLEGDLS